MSRSDSERIEDILEAISRCDEYLSHLDSSSSNRVMALDAIERNVAIIGEAAAHLSERICSAIPEINWVEIRGMRNFLVHEYFGVDAEILLDVADNHLPILKSALHNYQQRVNLAGSTECN